MAGYDYKFSLEKALEKNRHYMTEKQIQISELQISEINKSLTNREKQKKAYNKQFGEMRAEVQKLKFWISIPPMLFVLTFL
ncbi:hypothetical protein [Polluticaenibacter yanchengensis]|uniref:Uncharacterized protein n=1 Tax=Polluticaenibacter yanchengensis TaxID=3014562 RepID=A0ABT4UHP0_9BACT|nr:hypothetical protein [Chitinophagaceae bacterium LY-5]